MQKRVITNRNFWSYGIGFLLYINTIFELELFYLGLRVSEICIIGVLLFVIILIFNEINKLLVENYPAKNIKYYTNNTFYKSKQQLENNVALEKVFTKNENIKVISVLSYISVISAL